MIAGLTIHSFRDVVGIQLDSGRILPLKFRNGNVAAWMTTLTDVLLTI